MSNSKSIIPLAEVVKSLRQEIADAIADGSNEEIRFRLGPVEMEFQVEISEGATGRTGAKGGIQFGVISIGEVFGEAELSRAKATTHIIKLTLNPLNSTGGSVDISNQNVENPQQID